VTARASASAEFDRQLATLLRRGHPAAAGLSRGDFRQRLEPLRAVAVGLGHDDFVLVVGGGLLPAPSAIGLVRRRGRPAASMLSAPELADFAPIDEVALPGPDAYLVTAVQTGADHRGVTPDTALARILAAGRSPLTIEEGIALVTQFPEAVFKNGGFSLAGSRCGDKRVCALWISNGAPKLGWCWAGNPHSWLGTASCDERLGA
jgi:hypothetical protein